MRVGLDARLVSGASGGVEGFILGLAHGLSSLTESADEYLFLTREGQEALLEPVVGGNVHTLTVGEPRFRGVRGRALMARLLLDWKLEARRGTAPSGGAQTSSPPLSDGTIERAGVDIMHFTLQAGFRTRVPSIYQPHDLQHLHLPQFFTPEDIEWREAWYPSLCRQAAMVAVGSAWTKRDIENHYRIPAGSVRVVHTAPPTDTGQALSPTAASVTRQGMGVPASYILYPAQTWPHKNHDGLLRALANLRDRSGLEIPLVASGAMNDHFPTIRRTQEELRLTGQVTWTGFVSSQQLSALYAGATAVVIPTRFEAVSFPVWEAFRAGVAVACSNVTSLPDQAGDAALLFDPDDIDGMAHAIKRLWTDAKLRATLIERGRARIAGLSWEMTARTFRAHYRRLTRRTLTEEDMALIESVAPM
ncbi:hypothetical protein BH23CHL8_BH23CHL8_09530 [soil metagenome]